MKVRYVVPAMVAALFLTGCFASDQGSEGGSPPLPPPPGTSEPADAETDADATEDEPERSQRGHFIKEVGEVGGFTSGPGSDAWLSFTVDEIAENEVCADVYEHPLHVPTRVDVSIATSDIPEEFKPSTGRLFTPVNWQWILEDGTTSGVRSQTESTFAYACGDHAQLNSGLAPNSQYRTSFYFDIPEGATTLIYTVDGLGWEWELP